MTDEFRLYRRWFYAAAVYNAVWGGAVILFPGALLRVANMQPTAGALPFVQVTGMMVGVYAYGYYLLARDPQRYCGIIWIALAGKTLGPIGFVYSALTRALPWSFGWICVFNDVIWWPVFWQFAWTYARGTTPHRRLGIGADR